MNTLKSLGALAIVVAAASAHLITAAPAAHATESDVAVACFPHVSDDVRFDDTWGAGRSGGRSHKGTDIMGPKGTEVIAVADGVVTTLKSGGSSGYYVRLTHAGGWETWYMHLDNDTPGTDDGRGGAETAYAPGLDEGDFVEAGEVIGFVGDSGNAEWSSSHTHFELHIDGAAVNPYPYLLDAAERKARLIDMVTELAFPPNELFESDRSEIWESLATSGGAKCLPSAFKDVVEHVFGQLPGEGVLLTGVVAR